jgi:hypothetical protein
MLSLIQGEKTLETSSMEQVLDTIQEISIVDMTDHICLRSSTTIIDLVPTCTNTTVRIDLASSLATETSELKSSGTNLSRSLHTSRTMTSRWSGSWPEKTVRTGRSVTTEIDLKPSNESLSTVDLRVEAGSKIYVMKIYASHRL